MSDGEAIDEGEELDPAGDADEGLDAAELERRRQALAQVRKFGDPVLKSPASEIREFGPELEREAERMLAIMRDALGIGLAATQLGVMRRMLVFQAGPDAEPRAILNPRVEWTSEEGVSAEEGCLSLPGVVVDVERPLYARVAALDVAGEPLLLEAAGLEARVLQHEIDHLDGVLILDRTEREQRRGALKALRVGASFSPQMLEGDDPDDERGAGAATSSDAERAPAEQEVGAGGEGAAGSEG